MVKHTQIIRPQIANEFFECDWPFCGVGALRVNKTTIIAIYIRFTTVKFRSFNFQWLPNISAFVSYFPR